MLKKPDSKSKKSSQISLKARFDSGRIKKRWRLKYISEQEIELTFVTRHKDSSTEITYYAFLFNVALQYTWQVLWDNDYDGPKRRTLASFYPDLANYATSLDEGLTLAMCFVTAFEEVGCNWPELLEIAKKSPDNTAYGE